MRAPNRQTVTGNNPLALGAPLGFPLLGFAAQRLEALVAIDERALGHCPLERQAEEDCSGQGQRRCEAGEACGAGRRRGHGAGSLGLVGVTELATGRESATDVALGLLGVAIAISLGLLVGSSVGRALRGRRAAPAA